MECMRCKKNLDTSVVYYEYAGREDTFICMSCYSSLKEEYKDQFTMCSHNPEPVEEPEPEVDYSDEFSYLEDDYEDISSDEDDEPVPSLDEYEDISSSDPYGYKSEPVESVEAEDTPDIPDDYEYETEEPEAGGKFSAADALEKIGDFGQKLKPVLAAVVRGLYKFGKLTAKGFLALMDSPLMMAIFGVLFGAGGLALLIWGESGKKSTEYLVALAYGSSGTAKPEVAAVFGIIFLVIGCVLVSLCLYRKFYLEKYMSENNTDDYDE